VAVLAILCVVFTFINLIGYQKKENAK